MKTVLWIAIAALVVAIVVVAQADPIGLAIGTNSVMILPQRPIHSGGPWAATTAYAQGYVMKTNNAVYMALKGGTSGSTLPSHTAGTAVDGTVTWYRIPTPKAERQGFAIVNNHETNVLYASAFRPAVSNAGIRLNASGGNWTDTHQGAVYVMSGPTGHVVALEW